MADIGHLRSVLPKCLMNMACHIVESLSIAGSVLGDFLSPSPDLCSTKRLRIIALRRYPIVGH